MGSITHAIQRISQSPEAEEQKCKERLELMLMLAKSKIDLFKSEMDEHFTNSTSIDKKQIPGIRAIKYIQQYHVATKTGFSEQVSDHLERAIDAFFSLGEGNNKNSIKNGIKSIIQTGFTAFIGSTQAGEFEQKIYFVIPENNAFVRVDMYCWKYNFDQVKIINQSDSAVAYAICKSVVDHKSLKLDELIYLTSEALSSNGHIVITTIGDLVKKEGLSTTTPSIQNKLRKYYLMAGGSIEQFELLISEKEKCETKDIKIQNIIDQMLLNKIYISINGADNTRKWILVDALQDGLYKNNGEAKITDVEDYIDELIRVWNKLSTELASAS